MMGGGALQKKLILSVLLFVFSILLLSACNPHMRAEIRKHTYPPEFTFITDKQLKSAMWQLAEHVKKLDEVILTTNGATAQERREIIQILSKMEEISMTLGREGWPGSHSTVSRNIMKFRTDLVSARRAIEIDPPSYYLAGTVYGACAHCHDTK